MAIVAINIYALLSIGFILSTKVAVNEKKASVYDLLLIVNCFTMITAGLIVTFTKRLSFIIPKSVRKMFFIRAFEGYALIVCYIIGNTLVPITVQQTLTNTTPFWAAIIGYFFAKEKITLFETFSMVVMFGGVVMITFSQTSGDEEENEDKTERMILKDND